MPPGSVTLGGQALFSRCRVSRGEPLTQCAAADIFPQCLCEREQAVEAPYPGDKAMSHVLWELLVLLQLLQEDASGGGETNNRYEAAEKILLVRHAKNGKNVCVLSIFKVNEICSS